MRSWLYRGRWWLRARPLAPLLHSLAADPIQASVTKGIAAGNLKRRPVPGERDGAHVIAQRQALAVPSTKVVARLSQLVADYPGDAELQKTLAHALDQLGDERALSAWLGIACRFPTSMSAFRSLIVAAHRYRGPEAVQAIVQARFSRLPKRLDHLMVYAEACALAGAVSAREAALKRLETMFSSRRDSWLLAAAWLEEELGVRPSVVQLVKRLGAGRALRPPPGLRRGAYSSAFLAEGDDDDRPNQSPESVKGLKVLFDRVLEARHLVRASLDAPNRVPVTLLTGSLGAGGAERQLVNTATGLKQLDVADRGLGGGMILDPINVVARSLSDRKDGAFFLGELQQAGIQVDVYREMPDFAGDLPSSAAWPTLPMLGLLPWSTAEAVIKLTDWLRITKPEVVHIWQDGLVYAAGLSALLAGVPRIVLSGRSAPPPDRRERYPIEYDIIYRSLLRSPGVRLSVNSRHAAQRYASWLQIDPAMISVVPNGVSRPCTTADPAAQAAYDSFESRVGHATFTLGAVMRLDEVKRPLFWVDTVASFLGMMPEARVIIVGDGPFRARTEKRAETLGIRERCLFVGRTSAVGFWLSKMDALLLLSEHEGLPNALIEAQLCGVPVITTPAGGAPETLIPGKTGIVTGQMARPREIAELVVQAARKPGLLKQMGAEAEGWAREAFPVAKMVQRTIELYASTDRAGT